MSRYKKQNDFLESQVPKKESDHLTIHYTKQDKLVSTQLPEVFGPSLWFTLHNTSVFYPRNPSPILAFRMKNLITSIPVLLPCKECSYHSSAYINSIIDNLDNIVDSQEHLFAFFVDLHNFVNKKLNKSEMTLEQARQLYNGFTDIKLTYN